MANHPSAKKRYRQSEKTRVANHAVRAEIRTLVRKCNEAVSSSDAGAASESLKSASRALAKAASKGILHPRNASRRASRLARKVSGLNG